MNLFFIYRHNHLCRKSRSQRRKNGKTREHYEHCEHEENRSRSRHNVEGFFFVGVLYFGWPNQPSSGTMRNLHWYVIFMLHIL